MTVVRGIRPTGLSRPVVRLAPVADDPFGPVGQDPDTARDLACDLTASDRLCTPPSTVVEQLPERTDIGDVSAAPAFGNVLVVLLVIALVVALVWLVVVAIRARSDVDDDVEKADLDEDLVDVEERIIDEERPPDRWRRAAAEHRAGGRFRDAVRCEYRALVGDLARAGIVDEIPGRTSGEEREQLRGLAPDVSPSFDEAADIFDEAWFDDGEVTAGDDERFVAAAGLVLGHVLAGVGAPPRRRTARGGR